MLVAHYIGNHASDALYVRLGWAATRLVQTGDYRRVTHCEVILGGNCNKAVIASSSWRDGGVRIKQDVKLNPANWLIADVPRWDVHVAALWFVEHEGEPYDVRGALATVLPGHHGKGYFCNESALASIGWKCPQIYGPAQYAAICFSLGSDFTQEFFALAE